MDLYLIRHGETDWNRQGKIQGHIDIPLNKTGIEQAGELAVRMQDLELTQIISSDLSRAMKTAEIINERHRARLVKDSRLRERNYGDYESFTWGEIHAKYPGLKGLWKSEPQSSSPPNGEAYGMLIDRVSNFYEECIAPFRFTNIGLAIVSHNSPLKIIKTLALGLPIAHWNHIDHMNNTQIFHLQFSGEIAREIRFDGFQVEKIAFSEEIL